MVLKMNKMCKFHSFNLLKLSFRQGCKYKIFAVERIEECVHQ